MGRFIWRPRPRGKRFWRKKWKWYLWIKKFQILQSLKLYKQYVKQLKSRQPRPRAA